MVSSTLQGDLGPDEILEGGGGKEGAREGANYDGSASHHGVSNSYAPGRFRLQERGKRTRQATQPKTNFLQMNRNSGISRHPSGTYVMKHAYSRHGKIVRYQSQKDSKSLMLGSCGLLHACNYGTQYHAMASVLTSVDESGSINIAIKAKSLARGCWKIALVCCVLLEYVSD